MINETESRILRQFDELKGQFVITGSWKIERLVAIGEDTMDYYWITYNGRKLTWNTCVGRVMPLKGYLREKDYFELIRIAKLNHYDQFPVWAKTNLEEAEAFRDNHINELLELPENHRFVTTVCLDLY